MRHVFPLLLCLGAFGQTGTQTFEAADVHPTTSTSDDAGFLANGRVEARGVTMLRLISMAYSVPNNRITGGPSWLDDARFDVIGKAPGQATQIVLRTMLQNLLAERFHLVVKNEDKPVPAYVLTVVKKGVAKPSPNPGDPECKRVVEEGVISLTCHSVTMASLGERLQQAAPAYFNMQTIDRTGLTGQFDFKLSWMGRGQITPGSDMSLFVQLEKQLGIKAEQQNVPAPVVNVISVDRDPTPNPPDTIDKLGKAPTEFDALTFKLSRPDEKEDFRLVNGMIDAKGVRIKDMILFAYDVEEDWIRGGEKWLETDRYDILAKTAPTESADTIRVLVQNAMATRFKLKVHKEAQPVTVYALTANKSKLKPADPNSRSTCTRSFVDGAQTLVCTNTTMEQFAKKIRDVAGAYLEHPVVDLTGLKGAYDFTLAWAPRNRTLGNGPQVQPTTESGPVPVASDRGAGVLTLYEAVDRQMGLKLATQKHPMQVVVIDHMERTPTEN
jgi:uncharacterized protein (TIGR03435 family)